LFFFFLFLIKTILKRVRVARLRHNRSFVAALTPPLTLRSPNRHLLTSAPRAGASGLSVSLARL